MEGVSFFSDVRTAGAAAAVGVILLAWLTVPAALFGPHSDKDVFLVAGEILVHRLDGSADDHLPMPGAAASLMFQHGPSLDPASWRLLAGAVALALLMAVAGLIGGAPQALAAPVILVLSRVLAHGEGAARFLGAGYFHALFALLVLLVSGVAAWAWAAPSPRRSLVLGLAFGVSLLWRSSLVLLLPLLAFLQVFATRREDPRAWRAAVLLLLVPLLFLIPWTAMNSVTRHRFVPLEAGEADTVVIEGALGFVRKVAGGVRPPGLAADGSGPSALRWAAGEVAQHPLRYARGYLRRLKYVFSLQPVLMLMAGLGFWFTRKRPEARAVGLVALYFIGVHCFMALEPEHFVPLWFLLSVLAAGLAAPLRSGLPTRPGAVPVLSRAVRWVVLGGALTLAAWTEGLVCANAMTQGGRAGSLERALLRNPDDDWLHLERGRRRLLAGDSDGAAEDLEQASRRRPDDVNRGALLTWARLLQGRRQDFLTGVERAPSTELKGEEAFLLAHAFLSLDDPDRARAYLAQAMGFGRGDGAGVELHCAELADQVRRLLVARPARERRRMYEAMAGVDPGCARIASERSREDQDNRGLR